MTLLLALLLIPAAAAEEAPVAVPSFRNPAVAATGLPAELEAQTDAWMRETMTLLAEGHPERAERVVQRMLDAAPGDPRPYLMKARVMREQVSDQNHVRESLKPQLVGIHEVLENCIALSEEILERDPESEHGLLYRGWGKMFKAQLHALAFEKWSAGRTAKSGKGDLDEVLERDPDQGDALMVIGTYKYFAATLPAFAKIASWLLRIPGGDRQEGLAILERACASDAYSRDDARGLRGLALFGFEGAFEEAMPVFESLAADYPQNPRFVEPIALMSLLDPGRLGRDRVLFEDAMRASAASPVGQLRNIGDRILLYVALTELFSGHIDDARASLEILRRRDPAEPDWLPGDIRQFLAHVELMLGNRDRAFSIDADLDPDVRASEPAEVETLRKIQPIARDLYAGRLDEADAGLRALGPRNEPFVAFLGGELLTLQGRDEEALVEYERLTTADLPERWHLWQYFARLRAAEAYGRLGDPDHAKELLDAALDSHPTKDLLKHVTLGRKRWFEHADERAPVLTSAP